MQILKGWRPIPDICAALHVPYESVRRIVKRANRHGEIWVKKGGVPYRWLINTDHIGYQRQIVNILAKNDEFPDLHVLDDELADDEFPDLHVLDDELADDEFPDLHVLDDELADEKRGEDLFSSSSRTAFPFIQHFPLLNTLPPLPQEHAHSLDIIHSWPELCSWLAEQGVFIFFNALSGEDKTSWQWQWGEVSSGGCKSIEDAILSALKVKLADLEKRATEKACEEPRAQPMRRKWF